MRTAVKYRTGVGLFDVVVHPLFFMCGLGDQFFAAGPEEEQPVTDENNARKLNLTHAVLNILNTTVSLLA